MFSVVLYTSVPIFSIFVAIFWIFESISFNFVFKELEISKYCKLSSLFIKLEFNLLVFVIKSCLFDKSIFDKSILSIFVCNSFNFVFKELVISTNCKLSSLFIKLEFNLLVFVITFCLVLLKSVIFVEFVFIWFWKFVSVLFKFVIEPSKALNLFKIELV